MGVGSREFPKANFVGMGSGSREVPKTNICGMGVPKEVPTHRMGVPKEVPTPRPVVLEPSAAQDIRIIANALSFLKLRRSTARTRY